MEARLGCLEQIASFEHVLDVVHAHVHLSFVEPLFDDIEDPCADLLPIVPEEEEDEAVDPESHHVVANGDEIVEHDVVDGEDVTYEGDDEDEDESVYDHLGSGSFGEKFPRGSAQEALAGLVEPEDQEADPGEWKPEGDDGVSA